MTSDSLARVFSDFLSGSRSAVVIEDGAVAFDLTEAQYSISGEHNKCLLHLWSSERNVVRRVLDVEQKNDGLKLQVQRMGQTKPTKLEICRERDRRTPTVKRAARIIYERKLRNAVERRYPGFTVVNFTTAMDLERSFGPIYTRGLMRRGQSAFAVLGANEHEAQTSLDAALTFGILWLDRCRESSVGKFVVEGLKLFLPTGTSTVARERMAHLNPVAAKWEIFEFNEREEAVTPIDIADRGNLATRLTHCLDEENSRARFSSAIAQVHAIMPETDVAILSPAEIAFRRFGLEFARAHLIHDPVSLRTGTEIVFGLGAEHRTLHSGNHDAFVHLIHSIGEVRHADGPRDHPLWRLHPERWLESLVAKNASALDVRLDPTCAYSQVPAFSASDRAMMDVLALTRTGRLAVIELKAGEDIHLPLQGLDYWARVAWHHASGEFQRFGYFAGHELSSAPPLLFLVAPALHIHPSTDLLLRYLSPEIEWVMVGIDERWRTGVKPVFYKRSLIASSEDAQKRAG
jgi:hypothetical protein